jgi:hypothetical protein
MKTNQAPIVKDAAIKKATTSAIAKATSAESKKQPS